MQLLWLFRTLVIYGLEFADSDLNGHAVQQIFASTGIFTPSMIIEKVEAFYPSSKAPRFLLVTFKRHEDARMVYSKRWKLQHHRSLGDVYINIWRAKPQRFLASTSKPGRSKLLSPPVQAPTNNSTSQPQPSLPNPSPPSSSPTNPINQMGQSPTTYPTSQVGLNNNYQSIALHATTQPHSDF